MFWVSILCCQDQQKKCFAKNEFNWIVEKKVKKCQKEIKMNKSCFLKFSEQKNEKTKNEDN